MIDIYWKGGVLWPNFAHKSTVCVYYDTILHYYYTTRCPIHIYTARYIQIKKIYIY